MHFSRYATASSPKEHLAKRLGVWEDHGKVTCSLTAMPEVPLHLHKTSKHPPHYASSDASGDKVAAPFLIIYRAQLAFLCMTCTLKSYKRARTHAPTNTQTLKRQRACTRIYVRKCERIGVCTSVHEVYVFVNLVVPVRILHRKTSIGALTTRKLEGMGGWKKGSRKGSC